MNSTLFLSGWGKNLGRQLLRPKLKLKLPHETTRWSIVKGDEVRVISGPQTGQQGKVLQVLRKDNRILVDGVNVVSCIALSYVLLSLYFCLILLLVYLSICVHVLHCRESVMSNQLWMVYLAR